MNKTLQVQAAGPAAAGAAAGPAKPGRKPAIDRQSIIDAARGLLGPHRSVATLSLREVARAAGIAPNSFYRHFPDIDALAVALIEDAGASLRQIIHTARSRVAAGESVIRASVETFLQQLQSDSGDVRLLLLEGAAGSSAFKRAVNAQLEFFEHELETDLLRLAAASDTPLHQPALAARAITRLVFAMAATAVERPRRELPALVGEISLMVRMIMVGTQTLAAGADRRPP